MTAFTERDDTKREEKSNKLLAFRDAKKVAALLEKELHKYGKNGAICDTDTVGYATPENRDPAEIVVDASEGFIPLWQEGVTLRWRFQEMALLQFENADDVKTYVRKLFGAGVQEWGSATPIRFKEAHDAWDFELVVMSDNKCNQNGCTLASAFFPDGGRHQLRIYPRMFQQSNAEQVETMAHEIGHIFGLRHFFAEVSETAWPSEIFGEHNKFSIMNYGHDSKMTNDDREDLIRLYGLARSGELTKINETPIRLVRPFSHGRVPGSGFQLIAAKTNKADFFG